MKKFLKIIFSLLILAAIFVWAEVARGPAAENAAQLYFFNVGQGDAELIQKGNYQILIDGGPDDKVLSELGKAMPLSDRKIETVILTHPHADHLTGLNQVLTRYEIGQIYSSGALDTTNGYLEFLNQVKTKKIAYAVPDINYAIVPFDNAKLTFLWPGKKYQEKEANNLNNVSEVAKFCYYDQCALFTGDIQTDEQGQMFKYYATEQAANSNTQVDKANSNIFKAQILKIPHHGSTNGTNEDLIYNVLSRITVIEVGADNKFGHPHAQTLNTLERNNIQTYRTDRDGTVEFVLTEEGITANGK